MSSQELVERAVATAELPVTAIVTERRECNLRWAANALTTNGEMRGRSLTVVASAPVEGGTSVATVTRDFSDAAEIDAIVAAAEHLARTGTASQDAADLVADSGAEASWSDEPAETGIEALEQVAADLGAAFGRAVDLGHELYGFAELIVTTSYLGSSTGLRRRGVQPTGRFELTAKEPATGGSVWAGAATATFTDVSVAALYDELVTKLEWSRTKIDLPAGRYETLLPPGAIADLMIYAAWTANARVAEEGSNVFSAPGGKTRIGEQLTPLPLALFADPSYPALEAVPFLNFTESFDGTPWASDLGLPIGRLDYISDGVLTELIRNRAQAERTGLQPTPPPDNLIMDAGGTATLEEMIASTERGLLLTCLWYIRDVDPERLLLTGLTRDGVFLIEHGKVVGAVNNFRFNESPIELVKRITEVGRTEVTLCREWNDYFTRTAMPPIRVPDFNMSTVSQAS